MATTETPRTSDALPVFSRVSWVALLAGLFVTLAVFVLLATLGAAIGVSTADHFNRDTIATGAGVWAIATTLVAFFCGGCVVSRFTAGESKTEAVVYGAVLWGASFAMILWATGSALHTGATIAVGSANAAANMDRAPTNWEASARRANVSDAQINQMRADMPSAARVQEVSGEAAWWSFAGVLVSMLAAIGGAVASAGPNPFFARVVYRRVVPAHGM